VTKVTAQSGLVVSDIRNLRDEREILAAATEKEGTPKCEVSRGSHQIHFAGRKSHVVKWSAINIAAGFLAFLVVELPFNQKALVLMGVAIVRSIADYALCWTFYFPNAEGRI
jgi:hypothetical protein